MGIKSVFLSIPIIILLTGCDPGPTNSSRLVTGQWTTPQKISADSYLVEGYDTQDALKGGRAQCQSMGKEFDLKELTPHTQRNRATVTFRCY
jgi:hypothetical protein